jgi:hypothetical protein
VAARSESWACGPSLVGFAASNPAGRIAVCFFVSVMCCHVEVSAMGRSLVRSAISKVIKVIKEVKHKISAFTVIKLQCDVYLI